MPSQIRVMFIGQAGSGLPQDEIVNTFHFTGPGPYADDQASAIGAVTRFYSVAPTGNAVGAYLSPWIQRSAQLRAYDMSLEKPAGAPKHWRVPTMASLLLPTALSASSGLPEEVACCITMHGVVPPALSGRRRGRVYIGPLGAACIDYATATSFAHPAEGFVTNLAAAAGRLIAEGDTTVTWAIMSERPTKNFVRVAAGYVDNAFDIQRRRGPDPTARVGFGFPAVGP